MKRLKQIHWGWLCATMIIGVPIAMGLVALSATLAGQYAWSTSSGTDLERFINVGFALAMVAWTVFALPLAFMLWRSNYRAWSIACALSMIFFSTNIIMMELGYFAKHMADARAPRETARKAVQATEKTIAMLEQKASKLLDKGVVTATTKLIREIQETRDWNLKTSSVATVAPLKEYISKWSDVDGETVDFALLVNKLIALALGRDLVPFLVFLGFTAAFRREAVKEDEKPVENLENSTKISTPIKISTGGNIVPLRKPKTIVECLDEFSDSLDKSSPIPWEDIKSKYNDDFRHEDRLLPGPLANAMIARGWAQNKRYKENTWHFVGGSVDKVA